MDLIKGRAYAAVYRGCLSYGKYLGKSGSFLVFLGSPYSSDNGELNYGVEEELAIKKFQFIELYGSPWPSEADAIRHICNVLK